MEELSIIGYMPLCEIYHNSAVSAYNECENLIRIESEITKARNAPGLDLCKGAAFPYAVHAIVYEALAIEAYINFYGAYTLGDETYYSKYEHAKPRLTTLEKLKEICKKEFLHQPYPTDGEHFRRLKELFAKRDRLVHDKPHGVKLSNQSPKLKENSIELLLQHDFVYENLEHMVKLYDEVKENLVASSGNCEPIAEYHYKMIDNTAKAISQSVAENLYIKESEQI